MNTPAVLLADDGEAMWRARGPAGRGCADCHREGPAGAMKGVATRYPTYVSAYRRVMSLEDFLTVHGPETTGHPLSAQSADNLALTILIKMASNGLPVPVDVTSPQARAALAPGRARFVKRIRQPDHALGDWHNP